MKHKNNGLMKSILVLAILLFSFLASSCVPTEKTLISTRETDYISMIRGVRFAEDYMPQIEELGEYKQLRVARYDESALIYYTKNIVLVVEYDQENYQKQQDKIEKENVFISETTIHDVPKSYESDYFAHVNGFYIRVVKDSIVGSAMDHDYYIGFNDAEQKVAYIFCRDDECTRFDVIGDYIQEYCVFP